MSSLWDSVIPESYSLFEGVLRPLSEENRIKAELRNKELLASFDRGYILSREYLDFIVD